MTRAALALPPTYGTINEKQDAYVPALILRTIARESGRYWSFHDLPTTVALPRNRFAKSLNSFTDHTDERSFRELLREYAEFGVDRPSGYADVFHETFKSPRVNWSVNALLAPCLAGGWQQAISPGNHRGTLRRYDMRSAYLWAATLGLPKTNTYTRSITPSKCRLDGVYRIRLVSPADHAPFPFNQSTECIATAQEIETYSLRVAEIIDGVLWDDTIPGDEIVSAVKRVSTWKQAGRAYWGRWGQLQKVTCVANGKTWQLPNTSLNVPWAHLIISRVKMRLWEYSKNAVHVYVDSIITPDTLPIGDGLGDWRLEKTYTDGVIIRGPGQYGSLSEERLERMAGVAQNSPQRCISATAVEVAGNTNNNRSNENANRKDSAANEWIFQVPRNRTIGSGENRPIFQRR